MFLRRVSRPLMMMANVKETKGIVQSELNVVPNAREVLIDLYSKTLNEIKGIPEHDEFRKTVESSTSYRLKVCQEEEDCEKIEKRIGSGQVDALIGKAKYELKMIGGIKTWKLWSVIPKPKPEYKMSGPLPPELYEVLLSVVIKAKEERIKKEADERAKKEAEERAKKETIAKVWRALSKSSGDSV